MPTDAGREIPDVAVREETAVGMTEGGFESAVSTSAGTGNVGDTNETTVTPAMTDSATRTDIVISSVTMATDDGLFSAAEHKKAVRVTVDDSVGVSADLTTESTEKETVGAAVGVTADSTPVVAQKHAKPSPKILANKSSREVK